MSFGFKRKNILIFCILVQAMAERSAESNGKITTDMINGKLGEFSPENPFCNKNKACLCHPEQKNPKSDRVPFAEENEKCTKQADCCGILLCINGICRKPNPGFELVTLVKVCLGITITIIIVGMLGALIKCLIRYDRLQAIRRSSDSWSSSSRFTSVLSVPPPLYEVQEEKPPSYEECVRSNTGKESAGQDPPFIISSSSII